MKIILLLLMWNTTMSSVTPPSKHYFSASQSTTAKPEAIWNLWTDVSTWQEWDDGLKTAELDQTFVVGAKGKIISLNGQKARFEVVEVLPNQGYTFKTKLPLGSLWIRRSMEQNGAITTFKHEVWFQGITAGIFAKVMGKEFKQMLPKVLENIKQLAEA